jgi:anti-anti-sigma factor
MTRKILPAPVKPANARAIGPLELQLRSDPAQVAEVRRAVEEFARNAGFGEVRTGEIGLCINEALANVIRHAYRNIPEQPIKITVESLGRDLKLTVRDWGTGVNPAAQLNRPRDPLVPGGIGLVCLRKLMNEVTYSPQPDGMLLTLVKRNEGGTPMIELNAGTDLVPAARREGDAVIATLHGEIDLHNSTELRTAMLGTLLHSGPKKLILEMSDVPYMDSSAVAVLVEALKKIQKLGGRVYLVNPQPRVRGLLEIARLHTLFVIVASESDALSV